MVLYFIVGIVCIVIIVGFGWYTDQLTQKQKQSIKQLSDKEKELEVLKAEIGKKQQLLDSVDAQASRETFTQLVVSQMEQGVVCIDQHHVVRFINTYAAKLLDFSASSGIGYEQILHIRNIGDVDVSVVLDAALNGKSYQLPDTAQLVSQRGTFPITGKIVQLTSGVDGAVAAVIFEDNTKQLSWVREQQAFFSAAAHELRTPLTVIRLTVALLLERYDSMNREKVLEHLRRADETAGHLVKLVNDFLNISRIDQGRLEMKTESVNMVALIDEVIAELALLAKEKKLFIHHEPISADNSIVTGDSTRIKEIVTNLISNSLKYTMQGGVTVAHTAQGAFLSTTITDTGVGIPPESQGLLFKRFVQIGEARKLSTAKSTGLGLYISKKIAQLMHGDITLTHSEPGKGSTFALVLPIR